MSAQGCEHGRMGRGGILFDGICDECVKDTWCFYCRRGEHGFYEPEDCRCDCPKEPTR